MDAALGRWGEDLACDYLTGRGIEVIARNWRSPEREHPGEIDVIALDGTTLVICEVKTRRGRVCGSGLEAVDGRKAHRLRRLAGIWLAGQSRHYDAVRFDVVSVDASPVVPTLEHVRGAL